MERNIGREVSVLNKNYICKIVHNTEITAGIHKIVIEKPKDLGKVKAGQFFNLKSGEEEYPLLRRPISVSIIDDETLTFLINKVGKGTMLLCSKNKGEYIDILGPLGNGFNLDIEKNNVLVVGGGMGVAPLLELVKQLSLKDDIDIKVMLGYSDIPFMVEDFKEFADDLIVASEKKEFDYKGYVTEPLKQELQNKKYDHIFACGPKPMLKVVKNLGEENDIPVQLLMEERMACGMGACLVCTCKVKKGEDDWNYVRTCKEGPVFYGEEVIFDE
jgi:dihydroorotate dehydrogenase electron transfer subunit